MGRSLAPRGTRAGAGPAASRPTRGWRLALGALAALLVGLFGGGFAAPAVAQAPPGGVVAASTPLEIGRRAVTIVAADEEAHALDIVERVEVRNTSDAPFEPSPGGGMGPTGVLRFSLPRGAYDLTLDDRLSGAGVVQVDRGFGSLLTVPPGGVDVTFAYRAPYAGARYDLAFSAVYPTESLWLLVPERLTVESADFQPRETVSIGRQRYQVLTADNLAAGQRLSATLGNLPFTPRPWLLEETVQRVAAVALALAGIAAAWVYAWRRSRALSGAAARA